MPRHQDHGLNTYNALDKFLGNKDSKKYNKNCTIFRSTINNEISKKCKVIIVRLYSTNIVTHFEYGECFITTGGYDTQTTKRYIAGFSH